jgi:hypothetical protein
VRLTLCDLAGAEKHVVDLCRVDDHETKDLNTRRRFLGKSAAHCSAFYSGLDRRLPHIESLDTETLRH